MKKTKLIDTLIEASERHYGGLLWDTADIMHWAIGLMTSATVYEGAMLIVDIIAGQFRWWILLVFCIALGVTIFAVNVGRKSREARYREWADTVAAIYTTIFEAVEKGKVPIKKAAGKRGRPRKDANA